MKTAWAVDVFGTSKHDAARMGRFLKLFSRTKAEVTVVYVATSSEPQLTLAFDIPESERFGKYPASILRAVVENSGLSIRTRNRLVLSSSTMSLTTMADLLCQAMNSVKPDLIALQTHQRRDMRRWILGSFAETVIHRANRPLLLTNPSRPLPSKIETILFADDLSPTATKARDFVAKLAKHFDARLCIVHADYFYGYGRKHKPPQFELYRDRVDRALIATHAYFMKRDVDVKCYLDETEKSVPEVILRSARKEHADIIVVSTKAGRFRALMGGSVTRKVVRESTLPVIVHKS